MRARHGSVDDRDAARGPAAAPPPTAEVLGIPLALTDYEGALDWIDAAVAAAVAATCAWRRRTR